MSFIEVLIYGKKLEEKLRKTSSIVVHSMENNPPLPLSLSLSLSLSKTYTQRESKYMYIPHGAFWHITWWFDHKVTCL